MCVGEEEGDHEVSMARTVKRRRVMRERSVCRLEGRVRGNIAIAGIPEYEKPWGIWGGTTITKPPSMGDIPVTKHWEFLVGPGLPEKGKKDGKGNVHSMRNQIPRIIQLPSYSPSLQMAPGLI